MKCLSRMTILFVFIGLPLISGASPAEEDFKYDQYIGKLDKLNYLPVLLPLILNNRDVIELTDQQVQALQDWRVKNRDKVISDMNEIVRQRAQILQVALEQDVTSDEITQLQNDIFATQRRVLDYKLSCRDLVFETFNEKNWEGFMFVLAESNTNIALVE